jgi:hypothetical protein
MSNPMHPYSAATGLTGISGLAARIGLTGVLACSCSAHAIDLLPGEVRHPDPGTSLMQLNFQFSERRDRYLNGMRHSGPAIDSTQFQLRVGHSFKLGEQPAFVYAQLPIANLRPEGSLSPLQGDSGFGDSLFALAYWPYSDRATETYFGMAAYLLAPTGSYSPQRLINVGENRWAGALQAGFQKQLSPRWLGMAVFDASGFGDNDEFGPGLASQERKPACTGQLALRYAISPTYQLGLNYYHTWGGETRVNGIRQNDRLELDRYQMTLFTRLPVGRLILQYGADLETENGFRERARWNVRYARSF